jgi:hypothetical protein
LRETRARAGRLAPCCRQLLRDTSGRACSGTNEGISRPQGRAADGDSDWSMASTVYAAPKRTSWWRWRRTAGTLNHSNQQWYNDGIDGYRSDIRSKEASSRDLPIAGTGVHQLAGAANELAVVTVLFLYLYSELDRASPKTGPSGNFELSAARAALGHVGLSFWILPVSTAGIAGQTRQRKDG